MNTYSADNDKFKNEPTRRFYTYFYPRLKDKEIDLDKFFENMSVGISPGNRMQFFAGFRNGHSSCTINHIQAAWDHYGVSPNYLFGVTNDIEGQLSMVAEPGMVYGPELKKDLVHIRKLLDRLEQKISK